jgi:hypothetical protein
LYLGRLRIHAQVLADELEFEFNHNRGSAGRHAMAVANLRAAADVWDRLPPGGLQNQEQFAVLGAQVYFREATAALDPFRGDEPRHAPNRPQKRPSGDEASVVAAVYAAANAVRAGVGVLAGWQRRRRQDAGLAAAADAAVHENICTDVAQAVVGTGCEEVWRQLRERVWTCDTLLRQFAPAARQKPEAVSELCRATRDLFFRWFYTLVLCPEWCTPETQAEVAGLLGRTVEVMPDGLYWAAAARRYHTLRVYFPAPLDTSALYQRHAVDPSLGRDRETD